MADLRRNRGDFGLPVDSEHKATVFRPWRLGTVHMNAFHVSWLSFFVSFLSTFAPAALGVVLREDLNLSTKDLGSGGIASVAGSIVSRVVMGTLCDTIGPRFGHASILLLTAPSLFALGVVRTAQGYIACRFFAGLALSTFVACQFWSSVMFNVKIVGTANATGAGWGNAGGGASQLLMPYIYSLFTKFTPKFLAWRFAMWVPGGLQILIGLCVLTFAQDLPDGTYFTLRARGDLDTPSVYRAFITAISNHRTWLVAILYGYCFGVELTINNIAVQYFVDEFGVPLTTAGLLGSVFGLLNIFARSLGGIASDYVSDRHGMRGRLWAWWTLQTVEGAICIAVGLVHRSLLATLVLMAVFSLFVQAAEGAAYGVVPFISKRALGVVTGFVGAGGNLGSVVLQALFFSSGRFELHSGVSLMGGTIILVTVLVAFVYFPMWGGMFVAARKSATEEEYYLKEYTQDEIGQGSAHASIVFAIESRTQAGRRASRKPASHQATPPIPLIDISSTCKRTYSQNTQSTRSHSINTVSENSLC